jgi:hypothetical protein
MSESCTISIKPLKLSLLDNSPKSQSPRRQIPITPPDSPKLRRDEKPDLRVLLGKKIANRSSDSGIARSQSSSISTETNTSIPVGVARARSVSATSESLDEITKKINTLLDDRFTEIDYIDDK